MSMIEALARAVENQDEAFVAAYPAVDAVVARASPKWSQGIVRAVLEAMRDPTPEMVAAACNVDFIEPGQNDIEGEWQAMIDAVLADYEPPPPSVMHVPE